MTIDLSGLSAKQLGALIKTAKKQQSIVAKRTPIAKVRTQLARLAKSHGYSIEEVFGGAPAARGRKAGKPGPKPGRKLGKVPPKYRNPANAADTWTGRGKQPRWLADLVAKGKKVEDFLIAGGAAKSAAAPAKKTAKKATKRVAKKASKSAAPKA
ncbi:H-NS histone family protein [Xanthomonas sp. A2111]|uniref:H-NS histone family protein n=1 Tax=Xanthomonas hawaiiensis TaxID=3003247 RepID=A0ABU2I4M9_9XANT|nr:MULTISPECIES: H-NS histone family protein [unclassified Xanthomonas]MBO9829011.1 H-NS histone family protein [Xanthomonas sp. A2111]MBO9875569.1 H-NS histone family protein [Xanthomonas sp. D-93]MDS9992568.1 H-NS histone family protein [Xanthomonas sp. A2111]WNH44336.1 H-NS histone family protein [Xanthomonas sp. A6251]